MKKQEHDRMDNALRQKLANHSSPVPEDMWSRIQAGRKKNRIHPLGWYFFSASILMVGIIAGWLSFGQGSNRMPESEQQATEMVGQQTASAEVSPDNQSTVLPSETTEQATDVSGTASFAGSNHTATILRQETGSNSLSTKQKNRSGQANASFEHLSADKISSTGQMATTRSDQQDGSASGRSTTTDHQLLNGSSDHQTAAGSTASSSQPKSLPVESDVVEVDYRFATTELLRDEKTTDVTSQQQLRLPGANLGKKKKGVPSCYSFNSFLRGISVDAYFAPEYASRQLVYKDPGMIGYAEQRNDDESYVFAYSAGFRANAHFKGGLALRTGLIYTDIVERLRYRDENAQVTKVINVTLDTIYQNGNIVYIWDTLSVTEYGNYNKIGYNRYRFYDIPVMLGYEIDRDRWVIQLNTGILFNVAASQRGDFLDPDHQLVNFDSNNDQAYQAFRTRVGSSLMMSLGFNYAIRPKLHLLLEPQLRVWLKPLNVQAYPIDQKYVNLGLAIGIRNYF